MRIEKPEFVALQLSILIRSDKARSQTVQAFLKTPEFSAYIQESLSQIVQDALREGDVSFDELIISLDTPPQKAIPVEKKSSSSSFLNRLFGKE